MKQFTLLLTAVIFCIGCNDRGARNLSIERNWRGEKTQAATIIVVYPMNHGRPDTMYGNWKALTLSQDGILEESELAGGWRGYLETNVAVSISHFKVIK